MLTKQQRLIIVGLMAQLQCQRAALDESEEFAASIITNLGAEDEGGRHGNTVLDFVNEAVYNENEGDNPEKAADQLIARLKLEVEE